MADRILAGRYRLVRQLGEGGMGQVWEAYDQKLERPVAVKLVSSLAGGGSRGDDARARFLREARLTARLQHPNIVTVHDLGEAAAAEGTTPFLVMELLRGEGLDAVLRRGPVALTKAGRWGAQICEALGEAHAAGILHRDIKPANILITASGTVKVLDFGIARAADTTATRDRITQTGFMLGTPQYMAPEHARGRAEQRSDLYALGCVLFEMVTGRLPFEAPEAVGYLTAHLLEAPPAPSSVAAGVPVAWDEVVLTLLRKEPADRYGSAARLAAELRRLDEDAGPLPGAPEAAEAPTVVDPTPVPPRPGPSSPTLRERLGASLLTTIHVRKPVADVVFGPDGDRLAYARTDGTAIVADLSGDEEFRLVHRTRRRWGAGTAGVAFSPDGTRLATVCDDRTLRLWEAAGGAEQLRIDLDSSASKVRFGPDGVRLATAAGDGMRLWDARTAQLLLSWDNGVIHDVAFSPDGALLAIAGPRKLFLLDVTTGRRVLSVVLEDKDILGYESVAFSPDGARLAAASSNLGAYLVDVRTGRELLRFGDLRFGDTSGAPDVAFSPHGDMIATCSFLDQDVVLWDAHTGRRIHTIPTSSLVQRLAFSPDGTMLATASDDDMTVQLWRLTR
ncbi:WD40 repeat domain-containing serine/threonine protein kinase [Streptomyces odontomachi]|uniref:WD40 repeat domain-containing serine/threonine protein kinase n=1 Tax=Streptomyces odontomachi TaxID=2944940 RepID=UPI002108C34E|nr:serine/threonine-protein kinase [Streptomyces sp. ODS25]